MIARLMHGNVRAGSDQPCGVKKCWGSFLLLFLQYSGALLPIHILLQPAASFSAEPTIDLKRPALCSPKA